MTAVISLESHANGTKYTALVMRADSASRVKHERVSMMAGEQLSISLWR
ncbi:MAG: hypothetical protein O2966_07760 [Proteobacteria bacterium]|nr:hypothetical protein [Pseudomonadota bacterium]